MDGRSDCHLTGQLSKREVIKRFNEAFGTLGPPPDLTVQLFEQYCRDLTYAAKLKHIDWQPATGDAYWNGNPEAEMRVKVVLVTILRATPVRPKVAAKMGPPAQDIRPASAPGPMSASSKAA